MPDSGHLAASRSNPINQTLVIIRIRLHEYTCEATRIYAWGCTNIRVRLHVYTREATHIYAWGCTYIRVRLHVYTREAIRLLETENTNSQFLLVNKIWIGTSPSLPLFATKQHLKSLFQATCKSGGYSFYFHSASTFSPLQSGSGQWKLSGGYTSSFH